MAICGHRNEFEINMKKLFLIAALVAAGFSAASAQTMDHGKMNHGAGHSLDVAGDQPSEPGQSAFAAIQEIVTLLEANPNTDWSKVNIEALRQHLIDMSNVTLGAEVAASFNVGTVMYAVSGEGRVRDSIQRMVKAHADTMQGVDGWQFAAELTGSGATMTVTPPDSAAAAKIAGLGFIGVMTRGMHHQKHHYMIAKGLGPHH